MPSDYPTWAIIGTYAILTFTVIFNVYQWKMKFKSKQNGVGIFNNVIAIIVCYFVFIVPNEPSLWFSVAYFFLTIFILLFELYKKCRKENIRYAFTGWISGRRKIK